VVILALSWPIGLAQAEGQAAGPRAATDGLAALDRFPAGG
jgi:hypothetical protein